MLNLLWRKLFSQRPAKGLFFFYEAVLPLGPVDYESGCRGRKFDPSSCKKLRQKIIFSYCYVTRQDFICSEPRRQDYTTRVWFPVSYIFGCFDWKMGNEGWCGNAL